MKVVIIGTAYPMRGGIAQYNAILYKYFSQEHDTKIYSFKRQYPEFLFPGKTQYEEGKPAIEIPEDRNVIAIDSVNPLNWISTGIKIGKEKPDLIVLKYWIPFFAPCFYTILTIAKMMSKAKAVYICDNIIPHERRTGDILLTKTAFSKGDGFIVQSKSVENDLKKITDNPHYRYSPHPVYNIFGDAVSKQEARETLKKDFGMDFGDDKVLLFFGYIRKYKGLKYLLDAAKEIRETTGAKVLVVGEFYEAEDEYKAKVRELGDAVFLVSDFVPDEKVRYFFCASDAVILPYVSATQSGIVQIAYHYDKPVIATDVGGLTEVVKDGETGIIIKPQSSDEIVNGIKKFYNEGGEEKFKAKVKEEKKKYDWKVFTGKIEELYREIKQTKD